MFDPTIIILIPAIIFAVYAQSKVSRAYRKYSRIANRRGMTGYQAARMILDSNGLGHVLSLIHIFLLLVLGALSRRLGIAEKVEKKVRDILSGIIVLVIAMIPFLPAAPWISSAAAATLGMSFPKALAIICLGSVISAGIAVGIQMYG